MKENERHLSKRIWRLHLKITPKLRILKENKLWEYKIFGDKRIDKWSQKKIQLIKVLSSLKMYVLLWICCLPFDVLIYNSISVSISLIFKMTRRNCLETISLSCTPLNITKYKVCLNASFWNKFYIFAWKIILSINL